MSQPVHPWSDGDYQLYGDWRGQPAPDDEGWSPDWLDQQADDYAAASHDDDLEEPPTEAVPAQNQRPVRWRNQTSGHDAQREQAWQKLQRYATRFPYLAGWLPGGHPDRPVLVGVPLHENDEATINIRFEQYAGLDPHQAVYGRDCDPTALHADTFDALDATLNLSGTAHVTAYGCNINATCQTTVTALDACQVTLHDQTTVDAHGLTTLDMRDQSRGTAYGPAILVAHLDPDTRLHVAGVPIANVTSDGLPLGPRLIRHPNPAACFHNALQQRSNLPEAPAMRLRAETHRVSGSIAMYDPQRPVEPPAEMAHHCLEAITVAPPQAARQPQAWRGYANLTPTSRQVTGITR